MLLKSVYLIVVFIVCVIICIKTKNTTSIRYIIAAGFLAAIPCQFLLPDITINDFLDYAKEEYCRTQKTDLNGEKNGRKTSEIIANDTPSPQHIHEDYQTVKENIKKSKCNKKGSYDSVVYCKCGQELQRRTISTNALKHKYKNGVCVRCNHKDPDYVQVYNSKEIMKILSESVVSSNEAYTEYLGSDTISVFAKDRHNCFSLNTLVSYNLWGYNVQTVVFNVSNLRKLGKLNFKIGGETGCSGLMQVEIFINKTFDSKADYDYEMDASAIPKNVTINIKKAKSLGIRVTNHSSNENKMVFFGFSK